LFRGQTPFQGLHLSGKEFLFARFHLKLTAAGLFGTFTRFPFHRALANEELTNLYVDKSTNNILKKSSYD